MGDPAEAELVDDPQERQRYRWALRQLLALGIPRDAAELLAHGDWHDAERLIAKGCSPELVWEILR